jgi:pSer/pThr/pTyr-binding forkhead associated (FHA) protein
MSSIDKTQTLSTALFSFDSSPENLRNDAIKKVEKLSKGSAMLVSLKGANAGAKYLLDKQVTTLGRDSRSDIFLDDQTVSRNHALINKENNNYYIKDVNSLNGTYVNLENVVDKRMLQNDDVINIGKFQLTFFISK